MNRTTLADIAQKGGSGGVATHSAMSDIALRCREDGTVLYVNPNTARHYKQGAVEDAFSLLAHATGQNNSDAIARTLGDAFKQGLDTRLEIEGPVRTFEVSIFLERLSGVSNSFFLHCRQCASVDKKLHELEAAVENLSGVLRAVPDMLWFKCPAGKFIYANKALEDFLGVGPGELVGKSDLDFYAKEQADYFRAQERRLHDNDDIELYEEERRDPLSGEIAVLEIRKSAIRSEDGTLVGTFGIARDITSRHEMQKQLEQKEREFRSITENSPDKIVRYDLQGNVIYMNGKLANYADSMPKDGATETPDEARDARHGKLSHLASDEYERQLSRVLRDGGRAIFNVTRETLSGEKKEHLITLAAEYDGDGNICGALGVGKDITEFMQTRREAGELAVTLKSVIDAIPDAIWVKNLNEEYRFCNRAFEEFWAIEPGSIIGATDSAIVDPEMAKAFHDADLLVLNQRQTIQEKAKHGSKADGTPVVMEVRKIPVYGSTNEVTGVLGIARDITEREKIEQDLQRKEQQLEHLAYFDTLTGLPNRLHYKQRVAQYIEHQAESGPGFALLMIDLDNFKQINDTLGHAAGDAVLKEVAGRLKSCVRTTDFVARLSGDEFVIILENVSQQRDIERKVMELLQAIERPVWLESRWLRTSFSIGIAVSPNDSTDVEHLLRYADSALYKAKERGRNTFQFYSHALSRQALKQLELDSAMREGLDKGEFHTHFQPKHCLKTGRMLGVEALLRWQHHEKGSIAPSDFIPRAEETGLILPIGQEVLRQSCKQAALWNRASSDIFRVAVNISPRQLLAGNFDRVLANTLDEYGCKPEWIELEITEGLLLSDSKETKDLLHSIVNSGVSLAIDDFGTGYSALSYLIKFPVKTLKIDRSFMIDVEKGGRQGVLVQAIVAMAKGLDIQIVAEGVETEAQLEWLQAVGCDFGQGYFWSKAVPASDIKPH